jgi:NADH-quinone oxidoreductase subunit F
VDLHFGGAVPTADERAAVDAVLGTEAAASVRTAVVGHAARAERHLLLPVLHAVQDRVGWISPGALDYACRRLTVPPAEAYGVATFYALLETTPTPRDVAHVCDDVVCRVRGAEAVCADLTTRLGADGHPAPGASATWHRSPCLGHCEAAPAALVVRAGERPAAAELGRASADSVLAALRGPLPAEPTAADVRASVPQVGDPSLRLLRRVGVVAPTDHAAWTAAGGGAGLRRAMELGAEATIAEVTASGLAGRGGAAFPTGRKWAAVAAAPARPHHLVCNADESETGTFKDRVLMEWDPFAVLEGMAIAAYATGCEKGWIYLRGEYPLSLSRLNAAIAAARQAGWIGPDAFGPGRGFDVEIRRGAGAYICGEETALFNSIEGKRGEPRSKPPYPTDVGLFGKPTVVNNVETLANVPLILAEGAAAYVARGTKASPGTKLFCVSGDVARPGLYELELGATLRTLLALAGGMRDGRAFRATLLGGAAGTFVGPEILDVPLTGESLRPLGASLGSGAIMVVDDRADLLALVRRVARFFRDESCGQCVPCRVGTTRQEEALARLSPGPSPAPRAADRAVFADLGKVMKDASICGLGHTASVAVESGLALLARGEPV